MVMLQSMWVLVVVQEWLDNISNSFANLED